MRLPTFLRASLVVPTRLLDSGAASPAVQPGSRASSPSVPATAQSSEAAPSRSLQRPALIAGSVVAVCVVLAALSAHFEVRQLIYDIETPTFGRVDLPPAGDAFAAMEGHLHRVAGHEWLRQILPNQGGALWLALLVTVLVGFDARGWSARLGDLLLIQVTAWLLFGTLDVFSQTDAPVFRAWVRVSFELAALATAVVWARTFWLQWRPYRAPWRPAAKRRTLAGIAAVVIALDLGVVFVQAPDDSSFFANLGGQRLRERGQLPYGDPMLTGTPGAAYPPLLYVLHAGVQALIGVPLHDPPEDRPTLGSHTSYLEPPRVATQLVIALSHLVGLGALWVMGRRAMGESGGWALLALYAGSSYLLGMAGTRESSGGLTFVSHIVPASATLMAFAWLHRPAVNGALLAVAAGLGFYPAFFFPIWTAWHLRHGTRGALAFAAGFGTIALAIGAWVLAVSSPAPGLTLVGTIVRDTLGHHSDPNGYGQSLFGLWGQQTGILGWLGHPLVATASYTSPFFLIFIGSLFVAAWLARRADVPRLALLTAGAAIGANLWKIHATATYVSWYYPFLLLGLLALRASHGDERMESHGRA